MILGLSLTARLSRGCMVVLLLWMLYLINVSCLSCFLVCSLQPCGHLLGKGWPLGSLVCDFFVTFPSSQRMWPG